MLKRAGALHSTTRMNDSTSAEGDALVKKLFVLVMLGCAGFVAATLIVITH